MFFKKDNLWPNVYGMEKTCENFRKNINVF